MPFSAEHRYFRRTAILTLLLGAAWILITPADPNAARGGRPPAPQSGFMAPDFTLDTIDGGSIALSETAGRPVLLNLWASWCVPCRAEMPAIQRVYDRFKDDGLIVLAVNLTAQDDRTAAERFAVDHGLTFPILLDLDGAVAARYQNRALPSSYFIRPDGTIAEVVIGGPMSEILIETRVRALFETGAP